MVTRNTWKISRTEFESFVRDGFYFEEDTLEELPLDEVVQGVKRELVMKSFPVYQAVPRAEVTGKVWSTRRCESAFRGQILWTQSSTAPLLNSRSRECC